MRINLGLSNYYGLVWAEKSGNDYFLCLDDYDGTGKRKISEEFYLAIKKEFIKE